MATGYTRQAAANIAAGLTIASADINAEFNQVQTAFDITTGHDHSGSSTGTGAKILLPTAVSGTLPVVNGGTGLTSGTSGGILAFTAAGTLASSSALTANALVLGGGAGAAPTILGSLGSTTTVLHGNAGGAPTFGAVSLTADVTGTLPVANGGTGTTSSVFCNLTTNVTGTLPVANGGTGVTTSTGTGSVMRQISPTTTGTLTAASISASATIASSGGNVQSDGGASATAAFFLTRNGVAVGAIYMQASSNAPVFWCGVDGITLGSNTGLVKFNQYGAGTLQTDALGNITASSDERLKNISGKYTKGLKELLGIDPIEYTWKESSGLDTVNSYIGFSAQNVQDNLPEAVGQNKDGSLSLSDRAVLATLVRAIQELNDKIENK